MKSRHWLAVDTNFCIHRAYHGIAKHDPAIAILSAILDIERFAVQFNTTGIVFCFDRKPYHRMIDLSSYKSGRQKGLDDLELSLLDELHRLTNSLHNKFLNDLGYQNIYSQLGMEADDMVAGVCQANKQDRITIVSRDRDLWQLLSPKVSMFDPVTGNTMTHARFRDEHDLHPTEWIDAKAIAGCNSDGIPGVDGVAMATACKYLRNELNPGARCTAIKSFLATQDYARNVKLVTLPYPGLKPFEAVPDSPRKPAAWRALCDGLERPGFDRVNSDNRDWRRECAD